MNVDKLRGKIKENRLSQGKLAELLEVSENTLSNKMCGASSFTVTEAERIKNILNLSDEDCIAIFLS